MSNILFDRVGGTPTLKKVHKIFYDKIYKHTWLSQFFSHIEQSHIEDQQTDFMTKALGGPKIYCGRLPVSAHKHMYITDEIFEIRHQMLNESLVEFGVDEECIKAWLKIDKAFQNALTKKNVSDCEKRFFTDDLVIIPNPIKKAS